MKINTFIRRLLLATLPLLALSGCSSIPGIDKVLPDRKVEYKKSRQAERNLEIPPDLTKRSIQDELVIPGAETTLSRYESRQRAPDRAAGSRSEVLPEVDSIEVRRDGDQHWLLISGDPEGVWYRVLEFWQENGVLLEEQDPTVGVIVTGWLENLADIKTDFITDTVRKFAGSLYAASTRDQFRVRIENGLKPGTTELYLTHRGMQETIIQDGAGTVERVVWNPRETDHDLEVEMLRRMMVYLGSEDQIARQQLAKKGKSRQPRATLNKSGGQVSLALNESFERAWRLTGVALDRVGFAVEDRDRSDGVYYVRYADPMRGAEERKGWLGKLVFWEVEEAEIDRQSQYQIRLSGAGQKTDVVVHGATGVRDNSETAQRILTLMHEQLR
jgi:outer membrane protein assembly factor BamC